MKANLLHSSYLFLLAAPALSCNPGSSAGKESSCNAGDPGSIPGSGSFPGEEIRYPLKNFSASLVAQRGSKELACNGGDRDSIPGLGRSPGGGHGKPLQYSCLENPKNIGAWLAVAHRIANSWTELQGVGHTAQMPRYEISIL